MRFNYLLYRISEQVKIIGWFVPIDDPQQNIINN